MKIDFAHIREPSTTGGWINFVVFGARSNSGTQADNAATLSRLTVRARASGLKIDQSALAFQENGRTMFYGDKNLVEYLKKRGVPRWTHSLDVQHIVKEPEILIPKEMDFSELALETNRATGELMFAPAPLGKFCLYNALDPETILASEDYSCWLIGEWYCLHRQNGGAADAVAEGILTRISEAPPMS